MALTVTLTDGTTSATLTDKEKHAVRYPGISAPPAPTGALTRIVTIPLGIYGATSNAAWDNYAAVEAMLTRASRASGPYGIGTFVYLTVTPETSTPVYFDVLDGSLVVDNPHPADGWMHAVLTLICLPYARGDAVTESATATLTNGAASWLVSSIAGDVPALARLTISDESTSSQVINGVHVYGRSLHGLTAGHFDPVAELTATTPGTATTDASSYSGSDFARLSANTTWRTIAEATRPTGDYNTGVYDLWLRLRDSSSMATVPRNLDATVMPGLDITLIGTNDGTGSATTIAITTTDDVAAGDLLVLATGAAGNASISSITAVGGGTWAIANDGTDNAREAGTYVQINIYSLYVSTDIAAGTTITVTWASAGGYRGLQVARVRGAATSSVVEQVSTGTTTSAVTTVSSGTVVTTQAYQLLIAAAANSIGYNYLGWALSFSPLALGPSVSMAYRVVTSAATYSSQANTASNAYHAGILASFKAASATPGSLTTGTWNLGVVAVTNTGKLSPVTPIVTVSVANSEDRIALAWDAPVSGTVASYRVYRDRGSGWGYFDTGDTDTSYTWTTETGLTAEDPDIDGDAKGVYRVQVGLDSGTVVFTSSPFTAAIANSVWEDVLAGTFPLPPIPALDGDVPPGWLIRVQGKHIDATPSLDVDIAWLCAHDEPQTLATYTGLTLATKRDIVLDGRRDGRVSGRLYVDGTTTDAGQLDTVGQLLIGPGATQLALRLTGANGVSDVDDLKCTAVVRYVPRYRLLAGS